MKLTAPFLILALIGMFVLTTDVASGTLEEEFPTNMPLIYIEPSNITAVPGENFTISVKLFNLTNNFYQTDTKWNASTQPSDLGPWSDDPDYNYSLGNLIGLSFQLGWNTTMLKIKSRFTKVPVEEYPDGVLHEPASVFMDWVNETHGFPWPQPAESRYWGGGISFSKQGFNGNGTVSELTFEVLKAGSTSINITRSQLSTPLGEPIPHRYASCQINSPEMIPEYPSLIILPLSMTLTLLAVMVRRRKHFT